MKYYSEKLNKVFDTPEECTQAEEAYVKNAKAREQELAEDIKKIRAMFAEADSKRSEALKQIDVVAKKYGIVNSKLRVAILSEDIKESLGDLLAIIEII